MLASAELIFIVLLLIRATVYVLLVLSCHVFCLWLFYLSCQYLPSDWLERLLVKLNRGKGIISTMPKLKSVYDYLDSVYCFIVLLCGFLVPWPYVIYFILLWHDIAYLC